MIKKENKKVTIKKLFKKMTLTALLSATLASSAALAPTPAAHAASSYSASKYFPGKNPNDDGFSSWDEYGVSDIKSYRNFKNRSANIYVKDKKILPVMKKAAKAWAPVFKFKFVKSDKHVNFNSSKYANIVAYDEPNRKNTTIDVERLLTNPKDAVKAGEQKYPTYADGKFTNYKAYLKAWKQLKKGTYKGTLSPHGGPATGRWDPSSAKDIALHGYVHHFNLVIGTKGNSQSQQVGYVTRALGEAIGLGDNDGTADAYDIMNDNDSNVGIGLTPAASIGNQHVTQDDLSHVNWIYAHPWSGTNKIWRLA